MIMTSLKDQLSCYTYSYNNIGVGPTGSWKIEMVRYMLKDGSKDFADDIYKIRYHYCA